MGVVDDVDDNDDDVVEVGVDGVDDVDVDDDVHDDDPLSSFQMVSNISVDDLRRMHSDMDQHTLMLTGKSLLSSLSSTSTDHIIDDTLLLKGNENILVPIIPWTEEEDYKLIEAIDLYVWGNPPSIDWEKVSEHIETQRTAEQCAKRWNNALKYRRPEFRPLPWTKQEDELLEYAVRQYEGQGIRGGIDWEKVRLQVSEQRSANQCRGRWNGILKHRSPIVKNTPWSPDEDRLLIQGVSLNEGHGRRGAINWANVSIHMNGVRTAQQCSHRWNRVLKARGISANSQPWTDEEDERLRQAASEFYGQGLRGGVDWQKVYEKMGKERSPQQYGHRWNRVVKFKGSTNKNSPWLPEEDERLLEAVLLYDGQGLRGAVDWSRVSEFMGGDRTAQQCCHRWSGVLKHRGVMKFSPWNSEEDKKLIEAVKLYQNQGLRGGVSWGRVSEFLNRERSCQQCAHRWNRVLRHRTTPGSLNTSEWTEDEDKRLREAVSIYEGQGLRGGVDWGKVADKMLNSRTPQQYCTRWNRVLKINQNVKSIIWTESDDQKLIEAVNIFRGAGRGGTIDWVQVSDYVGGGRTREQTCGRWNGVLKHREIRGTAELTQALDTLNQTNDNSLETDNCNEILENSGDVEENSPELFEL